jgi:hypothetical protein
LPTTSGQVTTVLPGFPTTGQAGNFPSPWQFVFNGPNEVYVADSRTNGNGGLQKWVSFGGNWTLAYTIVIGPNQGLVGLAGDFSDSSLESASPSSFVVRHFLECAQFTACEHDVCLQNVVDCFSIENRVGAGTVVAHHSPQGCSIRGGGIGTEEESKRS